MSIKDREARNAYIREWKRKDRLKRGILPRGTPREKKVVSEEMLKRRKESRREWEKGWRMKYNEEKPQKKLIWAARRRAKVKGLPFNIEESDIIVPTHCPYLGIVLSPHAKRGCDRREVISLDRIIPELGYVKGNVEVISHLANTMKNSASTEELVKFAEAVLERYK